MKETFPMFDQAKNDAVVRERVAEIHAYLDSLGTDGRVTPDQFSRVLSIAAEGHGDKAWTDRIITTAQGELAAKERQRLFNAARGGMKL